MNSYGYYNTYFFHFFFFVLTWKNILSIMTVQYTDHTSYIKLNVIKKNINNNLILDLIAVSFF